MRDYFIPIKRMRSDEEEFEERTCKGKISHSSFKKAKQARRSTSKKYGIKLDTYKCQICQMYHNGKSKENYREDYKEINIWNFYTKNDSRNRNFKAKS